MQTPYHEAVKAVAFLQKRHSCLKISSCNVTRIISTTLKQFFLSQAFKVHGLSRFFRIRIPDDISMYLLKKVKFILKHSSLPLSGDTKYSLLNTHTHTHTHVSASACTHTGKQATSHLINPNEGKKLYTIA